MTSIAAQLDRPLTEVAADLAAGSYTSEALTQAALERAHALQGALNCFIAIEDEVALEAARAADRARASGRLLGPLHGVPLAHKDMYYRAGRVTDCGSAVRRGFVPAITATVHRRMADAGAVNLGRLNMTEFALGPTGHNAIWGDCRNPWDPARIPGGSSSGSGAAVAARIAYASLGSDTGGSTRLPASACGLAGLKPTYSLISRYGSMGLSFSIDTPGPVARTARDLARLLYVLSGADPLDPTTSQRTVPNYEAALSGGLRGQRIGVPTNYFFEQTAPDVQRALDASLDVLRACGAAIVPVEVPLAEHLAELSRAILYPEAATLHAHWLRTRAQDYSPQVRVRAATGLAIPAAAYLEAVQIRPRVLRHFVERVFSACDLLFAPTIAIGVPTLDETRVGGGETLWRIIGQLVRCTAPFNYLGVPAISVPCGFDDNGMPVGMQLVSRPFGESRLLRAAAAYQAQTAWHERAPSL